MTVVRRALSSLAVVALLAGCDTAQSSPSAAGATAPMSSAASSASPEASPTPAESPLQEPTAVPEPTPTPPNPRYWVAVAPLSQPRYGHTASLLPDGRVVVAGGTELLPDGPYDVAARALASVEIFDPSTGRWTAGPHLLRARESHLAVTLHDGRVLVIGGDRIVDGVAKPVSKAEIFDPIAGAWSLLDVPVANAGWGSATVLADGRVLLIGWSGRHVPNESVAVLFDPATKGWRVTAATDLVRGLHGTMLLDDGTVLVAGGTRHEGEGAVDPVAEAAIYDPEADAWHDVGPMARPALDPHLALLFDGQVLVESDGAQVYDPATGSWSRRPHPASDAELDALITLGDGRVLGLPDPQNNPTPIAQAFVPASRTWTSLGVSVPVGSATQTLLLDGRVLVAAGYAGCLGSNPCATGEVANAWLFSPGGAP